MDRRAFLKAGAMTAAAAACAPLMTSAVGPAYSVGAWSGFKVGDVFTIEGVYADAFRLQRFIVQATISEGPFAGPYVVELP